MSYTVRDGNGALQTFQSQTPAGVHIPEHQLVDASGNAVLDPIQPVRSTALEANHVLKNTAGSLSLLHVEVSDTGYVMIFDASADPVDGAVTPIWCQSVAGATTLEFRPALKCANGIVVAYSTTGPFTKTESAVAAFFALVL